VDGRADLAFRTDPKNHTTNHGYEAANQLKSVTNALNKTWSHGYDV